MVSCNPMPSGVAPSEVSVVLERFSWIRLWSFFCGGAEMRKNFTGCPMGSFVTVPSGVAPTETLDVLGPNFLPTVVIFGG